ncbi:hypothetical protein BCT63_19755 [Vibrio kanaloae]|uniref:RICIN domain-containing protein n=1 Tax=Vibrio kanaloae TaxID=170673 RepID=UPI000C85A7FF|nr:RICIN domain-containing protein [Vibrio kanaloae]PMM00630.1 hypothetical protein BCT63_19755 [Vibrio kanaloae]TKE89358.1 hypothetical protein FCV44_21680 [Vibrio kanaloae]TKF12856.1 hypothetical protein FCV47_19915 [Vibrio kanaloae]
MDKRQCINKLFLGYLFFTSIFIPVEIYALTIDKVNKKERNLACDYMFLFENNIDDVGYVLATMCDNKANFFDENYQEITSLDTPDAKVSSMAYLSSSDVINTPQALNAVLELFRRGHPILISVDQADSRASQKISSAFGFSIKDGIMLIRREGNYIRIYDFGVLSEDKIIHYLKSNFKLDFQENLLSRYKRNSNSEIVPPIPKVEIRINRFDDTGQVSAIIAIDIFRSASRSKDVKFVSLKTTTAINSALNGITDGYSTGENLWGAYLPHVYKTNHSLSIIGGESTLVDYSPLSDGRTEFIHSETKTQSFSVGGSFGAEGGGEHDDKWKYIAKTPFNVNAGIDYSTSQTLSTTFQDYSLIATPVNEGITWKMPIATSLEHVLIERLTATTPILTEKKMTPMMRSFTMQNYSYWELPGSLESMMTVEINGGYELDLHEWWWDRAQVKSRDSMEEFNATLSYVFDLGSPYLTREMTVLIRSSDGRGDCITDEDGRASLQVCNSENKKQLWGLDSESRYVNRASGQCLTVDTASGEIVTDSCFIDNSQQWEWRADRIHSRYDSMWRLYTNGGKLKVIPDDSMTFENTPLNAFNKLNIPWASYPNSPSASDVMPNLNGPSPIISPEWVEKYNSVEPRQRWSIEILREGI